MTEWQSMRQIDRVAKTASKTTGPASRPGKNGNYLPTTGAHPGNTGGKKGRSGRRPELLNLFLGKLRADPKFHAALEKAARDSESRGFGQAIKLVSDYDTERPAEKHQIVGPVEVRVSFAREGKRTTSS